MKADFVGRTWVERATSRCVIAGLFDDGVIGLSITGREGREQAAHLEPDLAEAIAEELNQLAIEARGRQQEADGRAESECRQERRNA